MARWFGYAFNPVNFYPCPSPTDPLRMLLEVNNTFGEAHPYFLDASTRSPKVTRTGYISYRHIDKVKKRYEAGYLIPRKFHVSPFNDMTGYYHICTRRTQSELSIRIVQFTDAGEKKLCATIDLEAFLLDKWAVLYLLVFYPLTLFLTFPRFVCLKKMADL
jgi:DUF1365 family protein